MYQWNKLHGLLVHSKCSQQNNIDVLCLEMHWKTGKASRDGAVSLSIHMNMSHTEEQLLHDLHGAKPDFTGLKVCSITSDERPREENKTEECVNYTALNPEKKRLLICKQRHNITSFIIYEIYILLSKKISIKPINNQWNIHTNFHHLVFSQNKKKYFSNYIYLSGLMHLKQSNVINGYILMTK